MIDELLNEYKSITISIIEKIGNDEEALKLIEKREKLIKKIFTEENNIEEIKNNYELKGEKFASMACRAAIKANDKIQSIEIKSLLTELETCENPFTCPHGRPTIVEITKTEIEKMFKRVMN